jgi:glutathione S-transferase
MTGQATGYLAVGAPGSRLTRVTWMLEELGEPYEIVRTKQHTDLMRRYNPTGKMPALVDGDVVVTDSAAICAYLGDKHADRGLGADPGPAGRAALDSWLHFAQAELEAPLWNKLKHRLMLPDELRCDVGPWTVYEFDREVAAFEAKLGGRDYALGERFSAADVLLGHCGQWARGARFEIRSDAVNAYFDRVLSRPALARAREREKSAA